MSSIYVNAASDTKHPASSFVVGLVLVTATFLILPALSTIPNPFDREKETEVTTTSIELPDPIAPEPPEKIDKTEIEKPVLEEELPPITLTIMEQLINPGDGGAGIAVGFNHLIESVQDVAQVFLPDMLDKRPVALVPAKPVYPYSMRGMAGDVVVEFIIDANGKVKRPRVVKSSAREFERPAIEAIHKTKWQPGEKDGTTVQTLVSLTISFKS